MSYNIDLSSVENLAKVKGALNSVIDNKIMEAKRLEMLSSVNQLPFSTLNSIFRSVAPSLYESKRGQSLIRRYVKLIKESEELRNYYRLSDLVVNPVGVDDAQMFINEAVSVGKEIDGGKYREGLKKLSEIVKECIVTANMGVDEFDTIAGKYKGSVNEALDYMVFKKRTASNLGEYVGKMSDAVSYINENKVSEDGNKEEINESDSKSLIMQFNSLFEGNLERWQSDAIRDIAFASLEGKGKGGIFEAYKNDCIGLIDESLDEDDIERYSRLNEMKNKLQGKVFNEETADMDILKMAELKDTLKH